MKSDRHVLLIVEDHEATRRLLATLMRYQGWDVVAAGTIAEGLERLAAGPDCVVLDLMLPDGDGETVLRQARRDHPQTRVAVTTGVGDEVRLNAARQMGADAVLRKPIEFEDLCRVCES